MTYPFHEEVQKYFPDFDYNKPAGDRTIFCDMRHPQNKVGHQQRAFSTYWALRQCGPLDLGLDLGSHRGLTPYCIHVDLYYGSGSPHPFYGGEAPCDVLADASVLSAFPTNTFPLVVSNHSIEHMAGVGPFVMRSTGAFQLVNVVDENSAVPDDSTIVRMLREQWLRVLRPGGILALVVPDNDAFDVLASDKDHKHAWGRSNFRSRILDRIQDVAETVEFDTFRNNFSFNVVLRKKEG